MTSIDHEPAAPAREADQAAMRKPLDSEIDVYGLTHQGKVRKTNQDNFLVATLHKRVDVKYSSLAEGDDNISGEERLAFIMMVADGVGGTEHGEAASRLAVESVSTYVSEAMRCYYGVGGRRQRNSLSEVARAGRPAVPRARLPPRRRADHPQHGHDTYPLSWCLALHLPPAGRRLPLLPLAAGRARPGHPRPDHGAGAHGSGRHGTETKRRARGSPTCSRAPSAGRAPCRS